MLFLFSSLAPEKACALSTEPSESARRGRSESFEAAASRYIRKHANSATDNSTALRMAELYRPDLDISTLPEWSGSWNELIIEFERMRDERIYFDNKRPSFLRRSTWLYAEDGCYARAAHAVRSFSLRSFEPPGRIFAFGRLHFATPYQPGGFADWWYHVAAAYRINNEAFVLDPSVEPRVPIPIELWLRSFIKKPTRAKVSICDSKAFAPRYVCRGGVPYSEQQAIESQRRLLPLEWRRLKRMGFDPELLLGEDPPWKTAAVLPRQPLKFLTCEEIYAPSRDVM
jgi:hypothetical protein